MADRYRTVAAGFTTRVEGVDGADWERPAPCVGWVARDVIDHLVEWIPSFLAAAGGPVLVPGPAVADDPVGAWRNLDEQIQALLDDPVRSAEEIEHPRAGRHRLDDAIGMFFLGDVLIHTWDLARATGQDEQLDPDEVHRALVAMEPIADLLAASDQYGPRVQVTDGADEQTRLLAVSGRRA